MAEGGDEERVAKFQAMRRRIVKAKVLRVNGMPGPQFDDVAYAMVASRGIKERLRGTSEEWRTGLRCQIVKFRAGEKAHPGLVVVYAMVLQDLSASEAHDVADVLEGQAEHLGYLQTLRMMAAEDNEMPLELKREIRRRVRHDKRWRVLR